MNENNNNQNENRSWYSASGDTPAQGSWYANTETAQAQAEPAAPAQPAAKKKSGSGAGKVIALVLCCAMISTIAGAGGAVLVNNMNKSETAAAQQQTQLQAPNSFTDSSTEDAAAEKTAAAEYDAATAEALINKTSGVLTAAEIYQKNVSSTVGITTEITTNYYGYVSSSPASGSGFIVSSDGYVITNFHVIEDASKITVTLYDGTSYDAAIVGYDESNDIAVLKVDAQDLQYVTLGSSDSLTVGEDVVAIGNPLGELTFSLTKGVVSALDREITLSSGVTMKLIQTDCSINSGNSGGALFNMKGEVIGITNAKYSSSSSSSTASIDNIGFAIPIDSVRTITEGIIEKGYFSKPFIGVSVMDVGVDGRIYAVTEGAVVKSVTTGTPADDAGLQINDVVTAMDGEAITSSSDLVAAVKATNPGETHTLSVNRNGETLELEIVIGETITSASTSTQAQQSTNENSGSEDESSSGFSFGDGENSFGGFGNGSNGGSFQGGFGG